MLISNDILQNSPIRFRYKHFSTENYPGFYHYHRGIEILFIHQGKGTLVLNRKVHALEGGCLLFLQPFQLHRLHFEVSDQCPYERTILNFEPVAFLPFFKMFPDILRFYEHMWKDELSNQVFHMNSEGAYISAILERFQQKMSERQGDDPNEAALMIVNIFDYLQSLNEGGFFQAGPRPERHAEKIMHWVEAHYTELFDLNELAKELHLSKHHVSHLFRTETGSSITDYVIARRIRQACWLLQTESISVESIGVLVGIPNFSYFCRLFKKITGLTPKQYRDSVS
jgi:AraC-like DNA-binding protein